MSIRFVLPFADVGSGIKPSSGAKLFFFAMDGVTPKDTFSDQLIPPTANTNPVISDSNGVFGDIYITGEYKVTLQDKNGSQIFGLADVNDFSDAFNLEIKKLPITLGVNQTLIPVPDAPVSVNVIVTGRTQSQPFGAYTYVPGLITLSDALPEGTELEVQYGMIASVTTLIVSGVPSFPTFAQMLAASFDDDNTMVITEGYSAPGDGGGANYAVKLAANYSGTPDGFVDAFVADGKVAENLEVNLTGSMGGMLSDGGDYTANLQALANKLAPHKTLHVDSTNFSLSGFTLFNNGFKKVSHASDSKVTFLGAGELSTTSKALYSINLDINGFRTNETILAVTTGEVLEDSNEFPVSSVVGFDVGDVIRIDKHICRIANITGLILETDRTLPIPTMAAGSEVSRLDMPNIGSEFSGPALIQFAADNTIKNYGFGIIAGLCFGVKINNFYGLYNASKVAEIFYCADSELSQIQQYEPTDTAGGSQSYAARVSNGNDNIVRNVQSYKGRHCVDITFSHRNKVFDCKDFYGIFASYLTHFNGCRYNDFIRCHLYKCGFGVFLGGDSSEGSGQDPILGDKYNRIIDSDFIASRGLYRFVDTSDAIHCTFRNTEVENFRDVIVPRSNGESVFQMKNCVVDIANKFSNVDDDYTVNFTGGSYFNNRIDGLFRGDIGTPGTANVTFNFLDSFFNVEIGQGRYNNNAKISFNNCKVDYLEQPFGEECGDQNYYNCDITCTNASPRYLVTVGDGNNCEFFGNTVKGTDLYFRYFVGFGADGTITFGNNILDVPFGVNMLDSMLWSTNGYQSIPLARSNDGDPIDGTVIYIDSDSTADPFKRKRVASAWVDWII